MWEISNTYPQRRAFVTGAASGLGEALCLALAEDGWTLGMTDMRAEPLEAAAARVRAAGGKPLPYVFDVCDRPAYEAAVRGFLDAVGGVDLVVNNAGVAGGGEVGEFALEDWDWLIGINFMGVVNGCHYFAPVLKAQGRGHLINTASAAAIIPVPTMAAYCCAKAAVTTLTEVLYSELSPFGVRVSVVKPQFFRTALHERTRGKEIDRAHAMITKAPYSADQVARHILRKAGRGRVHILFPYHTAFYWWLRRLFPYGSLVLVRHGAEQMKRRLEAKERARAAAKP